MVLEALSPKALFFIRVYVGEWIWRGWPVGGPRIEALGCMAGHELTTCFRNLLIRHLQRRPRVVAIASVGPQNEDFTQTVPTESLQ